MVFSSILKIINCFVALAFVLATTHAQRTALPDSTGPATVLQDVVVTASRLSEKIIAAPVSISRLNAAEIARSPAAHFYDAIAGMKGVQQIVPSLGFKVLNTRGFSNTTNVRFVQLVDNVDNQSPHIGAPIASALCPSDLDIDHVEIIQGVASALYGMNATNGLANFTTRDPFTSAGFSIQQKLGVNHVGDPGETSAKIYTMFAGRRFFLPGGL
jgi:iron complex outermembrane receptor protein